MLFHAFFKSRLFLSTGNLIHQINRKQDTRYYGNSQPSLLAKLYFISSCFSLMGFPFILGFYSKDLILIKITFLNSNIFFFFFFIACRLTISYSLRILFVSFNKSLNRTPILLIKEDSYFIFPILLLFILTIFRGNFILIEYLFIEHISIFECILGLVVISLGYLLRRKRIKNYFKYSFLLELLL